MNSLVRTVPYTKEYKQKETSILVYAIRFVTSPILLLAWLILFREKLDKCKFQIKVLEDDNKRKDLVIDSKDRACKEYRKEQQKTVLEERKKITQIGNNVKVEYSKLFDGDISNINKWLGGNYND